MLQKILVPLDGTAFSERALTPAVDLARRTGACLALVRVVEERAPRASADLCADAGEDALFAEASSYIHRIAGQAELGDVTAEVYRARDVASGIITRALDVHADTIVMTTHGEAEHRDGALGSVAARLVHESPVPLVLIGPGSGIVADADRLSYLVPDYRDMRM